MTIYGALSSYGKTSWVHTLYHRPCCDRVGGFPIAISPLVVPGTSRIATSQLGEPQTHPFLEPVLRPTMCRLVKVASDADSHQLVDAWRLNRVTPPICGTFGWEIDGVKIKVMILRHFLLLRRT